MDKQTRVLLINIPLEQNLCLEREIHDLCLNIQVDKINDLQELPEKIKWLQRSKVDENHPVIIILPQQPEMITSIHQDLPTATILVWDEHIRNQIAKKAGAKEAFNFSKRMSMRLLREIYQVAN